MNETSEHATVTVSVDAGDDPELTRQLTWHLQQELEEYEAFTSVGRPPTEPGDGAKGGTLESALEVVTALGPAGLAGLTAVTVAWLRRSHAREITLEEDGDRLTLKGQDTAEQRALVQQWIERRHAARRSE